MIAVRNLSKHFGKRAAVHDVSFEVKRGELFGLLGHNGAGKSTTLGMILGHVHPDAGEIFINGIDVQKQRPLAMARVGAIFETVAFSDYLSGWQNLRILTCYSAVPDEGRMREVVDWVGLSQRIHDPVRLYSHGMRQRLALAQALCPGPELLILDEPTEGLDPEGIHEMRDLIKRLCREQGLTVLLSSHLLAEVEKLCDRVAVIRQGQLIHCGDWKSSVSEKIYHLETGDEPRAAEVLRTIGLRLVSQQLTLPEGQDISEVVALLVQNNVPVRAVTPLRQNLEDFYLRLAGVDDAADDLG